MYPEQPTPYQPGSTKNSKAPILIALGILVIVVGVLIFSWWSKGTTTFDQPRLYKTDLSEDSDYAHIEGSNLYAYNGLAFYKTDLAAHNKPTVLQAGLKLPTPDHVFWADDQGAMMTFKQSFIATPVEKALAKQGLQVDGTTQGYTWYLNFSDNSLHLVSTATVQSDQVLYSAKDRGFYYYAESGTSKQLQFYDTASQHNETLIGNVQLSSVTALQKCSGSFRVCLIGYTADKTTAQSLYGVTSGNQLELLQRANDAFMLPTNESDHVILVSSPPGPRDIDPHFDGGPASLYSVKDSSTKKLGFDIGSTDAVVYFASDKNFYVIDSSKQMDKKSAYTAVTINSHGKWTAKQFALVDSSGATFADNIISADQNSSDKALLTASNNDQYIFSTTPVQKNTAVDTQTAQKAVNTCAKANHQDSQYFDDLHLFRIFMNTGASFNSNIKSFASCLTQSSDTPMFGYTYTYWGIDPTFKKIVTD